MSIEICIVVDQLLEILIFSKKKMKKMKIIENFRKIMYYFINLCIIVTCLFIRMKNKIFSYRRG
jgi:hypothetical protein